MTKAKQYMVHCDTHNDGFPAPVTHKQAKEAIKHAKEVGAQITGRAVDCKFKIIPYVAPRWDFSSALAALKDGHKLARDGWNGKGLFVMAQYPDEHSKMGNPYLYIDAKALGGEANPWVPSATDLFAQDWYILEA